MDKEYNPPYDMTETDRLNSQHEFGVRVLGFYIHPSIELPLDAAHLKIGDIGSGNGFYLRDVEKLLPASAELHGFDTSTENFPPPDSHPPSVFFHQHDYTRPFDEQFIGTFDIINIRLLQMFTRPSFRPSDWEQIVQNLAALLKPNGYVQWIEADNSTSQILHNTPGAPAAASKEIIALYRAWCKDNTYPGPLQLPKLFLQNGLGIAAHEAFGSSRIQSETSYHTPRLLEVGGKLVLDLKVQRGEMDAQDAQYLLDRAVQETRRGDIYQHSEIWVLVGRKIPDDELDEVLEDMRSARAGA